MNTDAALLTARAIWGDRIYDPKPEDNSEAGLISKLNITRFIQDGLGKSPDLVYEGDGRGKWCGAFAAYCYAAGGVPLEIRKTHETPFGDAGFASTYKLFNLAENKELTRVPPPRVQPGDVLVIGPGPWGRHITLCVEPPSEGRVVCIGGNQRGRWPGGAWRQGVTEILVGVLSIRFAYRWANI